MPYLTWNMQGSNASTEDKWNSGILQFVLNFSPEVIFLQECGAVPRSSELFEEERTREGTIETYMWGRARKPITIVYYPWDSGGNRCNLAVVLPGINPAGITDTQIVPAEGGPQWRSLLCVTTHKQVTYISMHAISPGGPDVKGLLDAAAATFPTFLLAGDFNREPDTLQNSPFYGDLVAPKKPTFSVLNPRKIYDYAVTVHPNLISKAQIAPSLLSDHLPVLLLK